MTTDWMHHPVRVHIISGTGKRVFSWSHLIDPPRWEATPKLHPRRLVFRQNWRRYHPDRESLTGMDGHWEYATDLQMAMWGLRQQAGLPDETIDDVRE